MEATKQPKYYVSSLQTSWVLTKQEEMSYACAATKMSLGKGFGEGKHVWKCYSKELSNLVGLSRGSYELRAELLLIYKGNFKKWDNKGPVKPNILFTFMLHKNVQYLVFVGLWFLQQKGKNFEVCYTMSYQKWLLLICAACYMTFCPFTSLCCQVHIQGEHCGHRPLHSYPNPLHRYWRKKRTLLQLTGWVSQGNPATRLHVFHLVFSHIPRC